MNITIGGKSSRMFNILKEGGEGSTNNETLIEKRNVPIASFFNHLQNNTEFCT